MYTLGGQGEDSMHGIYWSEPVAQTNADTIVVCIKDVLLHMNLRIQDACWAVL